MANKLVTIRRFSLPWEAEIARMTLEAQDVTVFLADLQTVSINWLYSNAVGGIKVQVPSDQVKIAEKILVEGENFEENFSKK